MERSDYLSGSIYPSSIDSTAFLDVIAKRKFSLNAIINFKGNIEKDTRSRLIKEIRMAPANPTLHALLSSFREQKSVSKKKRLLNIIYPVFPQ